MAAPNGTVIFEAGGRQRALRFTTNALCMLEEKTGSTVLAIAGEIEYGVSMETLRAMIWAGVGGGDLTLAQAGDLIDEVGIRDATAFARDAFAAAFPAAEPSDGENPPKAAG